MTDAVIAADPSNETEEAERTIGEKAYGFWIYLMSDAIIFALLFVDLCGDVAPQIIVAGQTDHLVLRLRHALHPGRRHAVDYVRLELPHDVGGEVRDAAVPGSAGSLPG